MRLLKTGQGIVADVRVKPRSKAFKIEAGEDEATVFCREAPEKERVNRELVKELSKVFKKRVEIVSGFTSKQKRILIRDASFEEVRQILSEHVKTI